MDRRQHNQERRAHLVERHPELTGHEVGKIADRQRRHELRQARQDAWNTQYRNELEQMANSTQEARMSFTPANIPAEQLDAWRAGILAATRLHPTPGEFEVNVSALVGAINAQTASAPAQIHVDASETTRA